MEIQENFLQNVAAPQLLPEAPAIGEDTIEEFIQNNPLFLHVKDKEGALRSLISVAGKPDCREKLETLRSILYTSPMNWDDFIFNDRDLQELLVLLYIDGKITDCVLATIFYRISFIEEYLTDDVLALPNLPDAPWRDIPLFLPDGKVNPEARELIIQTSGKYLTDAQLEDWFAFMKKRPACEQSFLLGYPYSEGIKAVLAYQNAITLSPMEGIRTYLRQRDLPPLKKITVADAVYQLGNFNLFKRVKDSNGEPMIMGPSYSMYFGVLATENKSWVEGEHHVFHFGTGKSPWYGDKRALMLKSKFAPIPEEADGFYAPGPTGMEHDIYHLFKVRIFTALKAHKALIFAYLNEFNKSVALCKEKHPKAFNQIAKLLCKKTIDALEDMDFGAYGSIQKYYPDRLATLDSNSISYCFWLAIKTSIAFASSRATESQNQKFLRDNPNADLPTKMQKMYYIKTKYDENKVLAPNRTFRFHQFALKNLFKNHQKLVTEARVTKKALSIMGRREYSEFRMNNPNSNEKPPLPTLAQIIEPKCLEEIEKASPILLPLLYHKSLHPPADSKEDDV